MDTLSTLIDFALRTLALAFSWPVAITIIAYWFRQPIIKFLNEIRIAKGAGFEVHRDGVPQNETAGTEIVKLPLEPAPNSATPTPSPSTAGPLVEEVMRRIRTAPEVQDLEGEEREVAMARAFAQRLIELSFERTYRNIFGSQIEAIARANIAGGITLDELRRMYEAYQKQYPELHAKRTFDQWFVFMTNEGVIQKLETPDGTAYVRPTPAGVEFLHYILNQGLPYQKVG